jgi:hypothetical protein
MKTKITLILAFIGMITLQSCTINEKDNNPPVDNDTISEVFEVTRSLTSTNNFSNIVAYPHTIYSSDMVLLYRLSSVSGGNDVWKQMPETYYFNNGTLDFAYNFNFTKYDVEIFMEGNDLASVPADKRINQIFRIVIVPGFFVNKNSTPTASLPMDYESVISRYNIKESQIQKLN